MKRRVVPHERRSQMLGLGWSLVSAFVVWVLSACLDPKVSSWLLPILALFLLAVCWAWVGDAKKQCRSDRKITELVHCASRKMGFTLSYECRTQMANVAFALLSGFLVWFATSGKNDVPIIILAIAGIAIIVFVAFMKTEDDEKSSNETDKSELKHLRTICADESELESVFCITKDIGRRQRGTSKHCRPFFKLERDTRIYLCLVIGPFVLSIVLAALGYYLSCSLLQGLALLLLAFGYISVPVIYPLVMLFLYRKTVAETLTFPAGILVGHARRGVDSDHRYIQLLARKDRWALDHVLAYMRLERVAFEKRVGLLVGALHTIGIVPGVIALIMALDQIGWLGTHALDSPWLSGTLYGVFGLYVLGVAAQQPMAAMDRMICSLELAVALKEE